MREKMHQCKPFNLHVYCIQPDGYRWIARYVISSYFSICVKTSKFICLSTTTNRFGFYRKSFYVVFFFFVLIREYKCLHGIQRHLSEIICTDLIFSLNASYYIIRKLLERCKMPIGEIKSRRSSKGIICLLLIKSLAMSKVFVWPTAYIHIAAALPNASFQIKLNWWFANFYRPSSCAIFFFLSDHLSQSLSLIRVLLPWIYSMKLYCLECLRK